MSACVHCVQKSSRFESGLVIGLFACLLGSEYGGVRGSDLDVVRECGCLFEKSLGII